MFRSLRRAGDPLLGCLAAASLVGCTSSVVPSGEAADAEVSAPARGVVLVGGSSSNEGARSEAVARFIRAHGGAVDDDVLRMVGAAVDFPAMGTCGSLAALHAPAAQAAAPARTIALLDLGGVTLYAGGSMMALQPRQLPDVAELVSGVVYSSRGALPSKGAYALRIEGAPELDVSPFVVSARSPGEPADVRLEGDDGRAGAVALAAGSPTIDLTWEVPADATSTDLVYVDVSAPSAAPAARCLFEDLGRATLPSSAFGAFDEGTVAVHRLHREPFSAHGVDPGEVRFDFARVVAFARR